jgi:CheY-like chemotaxis protein
MARSGPAARPPTSCSAISIRSRRGDVGELRRSLPANGIHVVRSGCEALEFLRQRGRRSDPDGQSRPVIMLLDEEISGMAGHSILRSMLKRPLPGGGLIILLVGAGRIPAHRQLGS